MDKTMKARVQHKHDVEINWEKATNFIPLTGEIIVYDPDESYNYPRIKIGNGETNINSLPFITEDYAKIADIPTKPEDIGALPNTTKIPSALSDLSEDATHRLVSDVEKAAWNTKSDFSGKYEDLIGLPTLGAMAAKSSITKSDLETSVQTSLDKADGALQTEDLSDVINEVLAQAKESGEFTPEIRIYESFSQDLNGNKKTGVHIEGPAILNEDGTFVNNEATVWDGYTPKRGIDYWTATDIADIKSYMEEVILGGEW